MYSPTIPAVVERMLVEEPYRMLWLIPQNSLAGEVEAKNSNL